MTVDEVGEIGQFLATLLVLQGAADVDESDKGILIPKLNQWKRTYSGRLASDTSERCLALLNNDSFVLSSFLPSLNSRSNTAEACGL